MKSHSNLLKLALCQIKVVTDKTQNLQKTAQFIKKAVQNKSKIIMLPELFNCPYSPKLFQKYSEEIPSNKNNINSKKHPTTYLLSKLSKTHSIILIAGSIVEHTHSNSSEHNKKYYNTALIFDKNGEIIGKYRKTHLFDVNIPKMTFKESKVLDKGNDIGIINTVYGKIGIGICFDLRFPIYSYLCTKKHAKLLVFPAAFNLVTGPKHWRLLLRARAIDNQVFVAACSSALNQELSYKAWGHSMIVNPWGEVISETEEKEDIIYADIDLKLVNDARNKLPVITKYRDDLYEVIEK